MIQGIKKDLINHVYTEAIICEYKTGRTSAPECVASSKIELSFQSLLQMGVLILYMKRLFPVHDI